MKKYGKLKYAFPPIITAILLFIIYAVKNIYPFGNNTIDFYDLSNQIVTYYCHVFDVLHGEKSLFYDAYTALGTNMVGTCGSSNISIFSLFFLFIARENILKSMSVFLAVKMMAMAFSMYLFLNTLYQDEKIRSDSSLNSSVYKNRICEFINITFSVGYAFSGFVFTTYTIMEWQDIAAFFPLVMLGLYKLIKSGKSGLYIFSLTMSLIAGYYLSIMILIYVFLIVGFMVCVRKIKHFNLLNLFISTVLSIVMSLFVLIPQIIQSTNSSRFGNESTSDIIGTYVNILNKIKPAYTSRWFVFACLSLPLAIIIVDIIKNRKKDTTLYFGFIVVVLFSELLIESVNLIWHYGSYVHYPIRNGFMITFSVYALASMCVYSMCSDEKDSMDTCNVKIDAAGFTKQFLWGIALTVILTVLAILYYSFRSGLTVRNVFHIFAALFAATFVIFVTLILLSNKQRYQKAIGVIPFVYVSELLIWSFVFFGPPAYTTGYTEEPEMENDYYYICNQLNESFEGFSDYDVFTRVKNPDSSLNSNYGLVARKSTLSNWTALLSPKLQRDAAALGYTIQYTRVLDAGGSAFSDALIGVDTVISCMPLDEQLYSLIGTENIIINKTTGEKGTYYIYKCKYDLPFGLIVNSIDYGFGNSNTAEIYNSIYQSIVTENGENEINNADEASDTEFAKWIDIQNEKEDDSCNATIDVSGKKALYYFSNQVDSDDYNTEIKVNGQTIAVPSIKETENTLYPAHFNNNALYLGTFIDEKVSVNIEFGRTDKEGNEIERAFEPRILSIDMEKFEGLCNSYKDNVTNRTFIKDTYEFSVESNGNEYLLLPISYDEGYSATVNGEEADICEAGGLFIAVALHAGTNEIKIKFVPKGMKTGIACTVIGAILLAIFLLINRKYNVFNKDFKWLNMLYFLAFCAAIIVMYLIPYVYAIIGIFS